MGTFGTKQLLIAIAAVALVGGGYYAVSMGGTSGGSSAVSDITSSSKIAAPKTLKDLLGISRPVKCTFSSSVETADSEGVVYAAGGKVRGDFTSTLKVGMAGKVMKSHMIVDETTSYLWSDEQVNGMTMAMKMPRANLEKADNTQSTQGAPNINENVDYQCGDWAVDASVFTPPAGLQFQDMGAMMSAPIPASAPATKAAPASGVLLPSGTDAKAIKAVQCAACEQAGEGKAQCLAMLGCSQ
jgi:hypothetical protein